MQSVLGLVGSTIQARGQKKAADVASETQMQMFEQGQAATQPYREAGVRGLEGMESLMTPEGRMAFMEQYRSSPEFAMMMDAGSENVLKAASATGGLRTGQSNVAMKKLAPEIMMKALEDQFSRYGTVMGPGAQMASQTAGIAPQVGQSVADYQSSGITGAANIYGQAIPEFGASIESQLRNIVPGGGLI